MVWMSLSDRLRPLRPFGPPPHKWGGASHYRYVPFVVQSPCGVAHQTHGAISLPAGRGGARLDRRPQRLRRAPRELCEGATDRVEDVRIGAADLGASEPEVQAPRQLVEDVKAGCRVLDLDRVEGQLRREPSDSVHHSVT